MEIINKYIGGYHSNVIFIEVYKKKISWLRLCLGVFFTQVLVTDIYPLSSGKMYKTYKRVKPYTQG